MRAVYLFQNAVLFRAVARPIASFVPRTNLRPRILRRTRCTRLCATSPSPPDETPSPGSPQPSQPPHSTQPSEAPLPQPTSEELLAAFEASIPDLETSLVDDAPRLTQREIAALKAQQDIEDRLEVLTALPADLVVQQTGGSCSGCGATLQSSNDARPGFMPLEKMEERRDDAMYGKEGAVAVCQRCYRLSHYGAIEKHLRVDVRETDEKDKKDKKSKGELSPAKFREVLERLQKLNAVVVYLVDIFDFHGTFIRGLRDIIGKKNPVLVGVNKIDLLPKDYKQNRVENWIKDECQAMGLRDIAGINLISSARGTGVSLLLADALKLAKKKRADIYIVGAANVGKSSFINQLMRLQTRGKKRDGGALTTSVVPGTTLDVVRIPLGGGVCLYDTPGLMMPHQLTNYLDAKELRSVLPTKNVERVSLRLGEGKAMFVGGLARLEVVEGKPFFFTTFFSPSVKVHPGRVEDAEAFTRKHVGGLLAPPFTEEGFDNLGEWTSKSFSASGEGWRRSCLDVVLSGLGWIAITGVGDIKLRVCVPRGVGVFTREPLMPFETQQGVSSYTGTQLVNRRQMKKTARRRRGPR